jgi:hypothetical protein
MRPATRSALGSCIIIFFAACGAAASPLVQAQGIPYYPINHPMQAAVVATATGASLGMLLALLLGTTLPRSFIILLGLTLGYLLPETLTRFVIRFADFDSFLGCRPYLFLIQLVAIFAGPIVGAWALRSSSGFGKRAGTNSLVFAAATAGTCGAAALFHPIDPTWTRDGAFHASVLAIVIPTLTAAVVGLWLGRDRIVRRGCGFDPVLAPPTEQSAAR